MGAKFKASAAMMIVPPSSPAKADRPRLPCGDSATRLALSRRAALTGLALLPAACTSPNPSLYVLAVEPGPVRNGAPKVIQLRAVAIPHYLERSQIVRSSDGYRMDVLSNDWWGEPLDSLFGRVLVQELNQRLSGSMVYGDSGAISAPADATVEINVQRFDLDRSGSVLLAAQIAVDGKRLVTRGVRFNARPADASVSALVAAMSVTVGQLADTVAGMV